MLNGEDKTYKDYIYRERATQLGRAQAISGYVTIARSDSDGSPIGRQQVVHVNGSFRCLDEGRTEAEKRIKAMIDDEALGSRPDLFWPSRMARIMTPVKETGPSFVMLGFLETMGGRHVESSLGRRRGVLLPLHSLEVEIRGLGSIGIVRAPDRSCERICPGSATQGQGHIQ